VTGAPLTYVLPLRTAAGEPVDELADYLRWLGGHVTEIVVVDGSDPEVVDAHRRAFPPNHVVVVPPDERTPMGKVGGVMTGMRRASCDHVVVADDDVRYDAGGLRRVAELLQRADVVRPANHFSPLPWHARVDTGRILLNRVLGGDWPGTLGVRRARLLAAGGYDGAALFENLELVRTVQAMGGTEVVAQDVHVRRLPPTTAHFLGQRVRQAYDELARPGRLLASLAVAPTVVVLVARRRWPALGLAVATTIAAAEAGRRRDGGRHVFPASASLLAPVWVAERAVCSWLAVAARLRGGVPYRDGRLRKAASSPRELRARLGGRALEASGFTGPGPGQHPGMRPYQLTQRLERATGLDGVARVVQRNVQAVVRTGPAKDALSGTWLGHPVHPVLVFGPLGFWYGASYLDLVGGRGSQAAADKLVAAGVVSALPTAVAGASDWSDTGGAERRVGMAHALVNTAGLACFTASLVARRRGRRGAGVALSLVGHAFVSVGGFLGGHLTYGTGVGVDTTAFRSGPEEWTDLIAADELAEGRPVGADVEGARLLLVRDGGEVRALDARCTHRGGPLDEGEISEGCVTCPWHGSRFDLATGDVVRGPAAHPQPTYDVRIVDGRVEVRRSDPRDNRHPGA
jgi:nitrite reductase/ring-hydroxylating ferredoxin subunit/uncharacterized membrane protein